MQDMDLGAVNDKTMKRHDSYFEILKNNHCNTP